jgi:hypothetical protein
MNVFPPWLDSPQWAMTTPLSRFHDHNQTHHNRTPLDEWSAWCRDLYMTTHNTHTRQTFGGIRTRNSSKLAAAGIGCNWPRIRELLSELIGCKLSFMCRPYRELHWRLYVVFALNPSLISITSSFDMQHMLRIFFNNCISLTTARDLTLSEELLLSRCQLSF